ncbi:MAG: polysaccharide biosynthesis tyrosine autokinase [Verrucomicrobiales bacterium]
MIIQAQSELDELRARLRQTALDVAENFAQRYAAARQNEAKLEQQVKEQRATVLRLAEARLGFADLERDVSLSREQYQNVADRLKELETVSGISDSEIHLAEEPLVASRPSWPPKKIIVGLAFIFGCSLGAALIIGADLAGGALQTAAQAEKALGIPSLASIPEAGIASLEQGLIMRGDRNSPAAEAFRSLRTSLSFINQGGSARSYLFTSPSEDDGKTFCAMNFATALAFQGYRTLLIDADLRKPSLSRVFLHETGTIGLTDHLEGRVEPSQACFETDVENLYLFCAGSPAQNPAELLADVRFGALLHESYKWFDKVIIDSSAVGRVSDALSLAQHAESTVLIIRAGRTRRADAARASRLLAMAGAPPVGFIMNGTEAPKDRPAFRFADRQRPAPVLHAAPRFLGMAGGRDPELSHN